MSAVIYGQMGLMQLFVICTIVKWKRSLEKCQIVVEGFETRGMLQSSI